MIDCEYFKIYKDEISCTHPTYGEEYTESFKSHLPDRCKLCRMLCEGIYPSQLPRADQTDWEYEVITSGYNALGIYEDDIVLKSYSQNDNVIINRRE